MVNCEYFGLRPAFQARRQIVFTGPIDQYFHYDLGRLAYRGQSREHTYFPEVEYSLPCGQVNNPNPRQGPHIRTLEWKHMMPANFAARIKGTVLTTETPISPTDPNQYEYPYPDAINSTLYQKYADRAAEVPKVLFCGRLGEYRYYDMDQAIARGIQIGKMLLADGPIEGPK
jgi:UDP-galactopyranose mutase